jgi:hypothetical protein
MMDDQQRHRFAAASFCIVMGYMAALASLQQAGAFFLLLDSHMATTTTNNGHRWVQCSRWSAARCVQGHPVVTTNELDEQRCQKTIVDLSFNSVTARFWCGPQTADK